MSVFHGQAQARHAGQRHRAVAECRPVLRRAAVARRRVAGVDRGPAVAHLRDHVASCGGLPRRRTRVPGDVGGRSAAWRPARGAGVAGTCRASPLRNAGISQSADLIRRRPSRLLLWLDGSIDAAAATRGAEPRRDGRGEARGRADAVSIRCSSDCGTAEPSNNACSTRPPYDPALLVSQLSAQGDSTLTIPGTRGFWSVVFSDTAEGAGKAARTAPSPIPWDQPADFGWLCEQIFKGDQPEYRHRFMMVLFAARHSSGITKESSRDAADAIRAVAAYPTLIPSVERAGVTRHQDVRGGSAPRGHAHRHRRRQPRVPRADAVSGGAGDDRAVGFTRQPQAGGGSQAHLIAVGDRYRRARRL